jgi:lysozyme family protein
MSKINYNPVLRAEYQYLFDTCIIKSEKYVTVDAVVNKIVAGKSRYETVGLPLNIPWHFIGIVHYMEGNCNFKTHLHNGDPLTAKTIHVPEGRPVGGTAPYTWEFSAQDALKLKNLEKWPDWDIPGVLYKLEQYNGFGYRNLMQPIPSPYLWSFSNHYNKGKYVSDGHYDPNAVSAQCGAAVILRRFTEKQLIAGVIDRISLTRQLAQEVSFSPLKYAVKAEQLQRWLVKLGAIIKIDGKAGRFTSDAYKNITGEYLSGDPR